MYNDDFEELRLHFVAADMVMFAALMYYFGFSSQLKIVIDRFYALNGLIKGSEKKSVLLPIYLHFHLNSADVDALRTEYFDSKTIKNNK